MPFPMMPWANAPQSADPSRDGGMAGSFANLLSRILMERRSLSDLPETTPPQQFQSGILGPTAAGPQPNRYPFLDSTGPFMQGGYNDQPTEQYRLRQKDAAQVDAGGLKRFEQMMEQSLGSDWSSGPDAKTFFPKLYGPWWERGSF